MIDEDSRRRAYEGFLEWMTTNETLTELERRAYGGALECFRAFLQTPSSKERATGHGSHEGTPLHRTRLPCKIVNSLKAEGIEYVEDLTLHTAKEVLSYNGIGKKGLGRVRQSLSRRGMSLAGE
jgi:DNA-directed RNA polymerase alpha subunit